MMVKSQLQEPGMAGAIEPIVRKQKKREINVSAQFDFVPSPIFHVCVCMLFLCVGTCGCACMCVPVETWG